MSLNQFLEQRPAVDSKSTFVADVAVINPVTVPFELILYGLVLDEVNAVFDSPFPASGIKRKSCASAARPCCILARPP
jgi:hypothetical protein